MKYACALVAALLLNAFANLLMKIGMKTVHESGGLLSHGPLAGLYAILSRPSLIVGLLCFALNATFYMYALQSPALKISIAYPAMVGGGYALIVAVAHLHPALRESLTPGQWIGVAAVLAGILVIAWSTPVSRSP